MKKITILILCFLFISTSFGQDKEETKKKEKKETNTSQLEEEKKFQIGLALTSAVGWYRPKTNFVNPKGLDATFGFGMHMNIMFAKNVGLSTGINFDWDWYHLEFTDTVFHRHNASEITRKKDENGSDQGLLLKSRVYKTVSLSIPTMLIFKTNLIGYFKYYGKFGLRTNIVVGQNADDTGLDYDNTLSMPTATEDITYSKLKTSSDLLWIRTAVGVGGGFEYYFTKSNAFYAEVAFYYGFTNLHTGNQIGNDGQRNKTLINSNNEYFHLKSNLNQLFLKVGIMF